MNHERPGSAIHRLVAVIFAEMQKRQIDRIAAEETSEEQIRLRAYELYEARGWEDSHDIDDWLTAEAEITGRAERAAA